MALLKEDGSLDIERINKLPINEYMNEVGGLTDDDFEEYLSKTPINEKCNTVPIYIVKGSLEEDAKRNGFIKASDAINNIRKKYNIK